MNIARNATIKKELIARWDKLGYTDAFIVKDAKERSPEIKLATAPLSRWKNDKIDANGKRFHISDNQCLWLCFRYGIWVNLNFGTPVVIGGKLQYVIEDYSESESLRRLRIVFPPKKAVKKKK